MPEKRRRLRGIGSSICGLACSFPLRSLSNFPAPKVLLDPTRLCLVFGDRRILLRICVLFIEVELATFAFSLAVWI